MKIKISELRKNILETMSSKGFSDSDSGIVADYLIWAESSENNTMGIIKMTGSEPLQDIKPMHEIKVERDTKLSQLINAGANPSPIVSVMATDVAISKAKEHGFGLVGVHNYFSSNGAQAYYAERIAKEDLIGIVLSSPVSSVAPFDSIDSLFGTNPLGYAMPTLNEPLVFDMATSIVPWYSLVLAKAKGEKIPDNLAIDKNGNISTDPREIMDGGALLPFDRGHKGSALGLMIEILAGPLVKASYTASEGEWGALFIALDPNLLVDVAEFKASCSDLLNTIKSSRKKPGVEEIRLPGERALKARKEAERTGMVDVDEEILKELGYI